MENALINFLNIKRHVTMKKLNIAVDGFSSTGKSSISKIIAEKLGIIHMDTGALYRGITYFSLKNCFDDPTKSIDFGILSQNLDNIKLEFKNINGDLILYLNGIDISKEIRDPEISQFVSIVAKQQFVRDFLLNYQRTMAENNSVIMDGRDIGTVVLPNANFKFFLTASIEERTNRRFLELKGQGVDIDKQSVMENLVIRDKIDSERTTSPLKMADDAILIDNSNLTKQETIELILSKISI